MPGNRSHKVTMASLEKGRFNPFSFRRRAAAIASAIVSVGIQATEHIIVAPSLNNTVFQPPDSFRAAFVGAQWREKRYNIAVDQ
jgi:hypothetical protein